jgi:hypothetical protein
MMWNARAVSELQRTVDDPVRVLGDRSGLGLVRRRARHDRSGRGTPVLPDLTDLPGLARLRQRRPARAAGTPLREGEGRPPALRVHRDEAGEVHGSPARQPSLVERRSWYLLIGDTDV